MDINFDSFTYSGVFILFVHVSMYIHKKVHDVVRRLALRSNVSNTYAMTSAQHHMRATNQARRDKKKRLDNQIDVTDSRLKFTPYEVGTETGEKSISRGYIATYFLPLAQVYSRANNKPAWWVDQFWKHPNSCEVPDKNSVSQSSGT